MAGKLNLDQIANYEDQEITVQAWIENVRDLKKIQFLVLDDGTSQVQATNWKPAADTALTDIISSLQKGSTVSITGKVKENPDVKLNPYEIEVTGITPTSEVHEASPIDENSARDHRLDYRHLDLRVPKNRLIFEVQTTAEHAMRQYWREQKFIEIHSPKLVPGASESGAELFKIEYFGQQASLAQSPQFYKQMAMASGFNRVFEIGPVFRANKSHTKRHDTEFTSVDVEMSWIDSHEDIMQFEEAWLQHVLQEVVNYHGEDIFNTFGAEVVVPKTPFPRITMAEAIELMADKGHQIPAESKGDLDPTGEKILGEHYKQEVGHDFVFVTEFPTSVRPFYHMRQDDNPALTRSYDLLWKGLEVTTGAQREHRYSKLLAQAEEKGADIPTLQPYLNFFKNGCPPHGGFGFGLTRMLMNILNVENVRDVTYVYRGVNRITP